MRWLWPGGLAGRLALVLAVALVAVQLATLPFLLRQQADAAERLFQESTVDRMGHILRLLEPLGAADRRALLPAISSPFLSLDLFYEPTVDDLQASDVSDLAVQLSRQLQRDVFIKRVEEESQGLPALLPTRQRIAIWVPLGDDSWIRFSTQSSLASDGWVAHFSAQLLLVCLALVIFAIVAARQLTRPIHTFIAAAERLGNDVNAPPIPEKGSHELRRVTRVFNTMQGQLQRYVEDRTRMLAAISHDLRTSLTRLRLRTQFIDDPIQQRKAEQDLEQMDAMLASTLAFARDDAAQETPVLLDLAGLLQTLCDDFTDMGETVSYAGPDNFTLRCRPMVLERAVSNVLSNAVGYGGNAAVSLLPGEHGCDICIDDNGPGIPESDLAGVFDPFVRLEPSRNRSTGGTGLGLSIARSVIRSHGGDVTLENRPGGGLRATLHLAEAAN
jgi:signal transduction histidine kinase